MAAIVSRSMLSGLTLLASAVMLLACGSGGVGGGGPSSTHSHSTPVTPALNGFPAAIIPASNPYTEEKMQLGRQLFYDTRLSGNGSQSCASCHQQDKAFTDGRPLAIGSTGETHPRNSQGLANVVYHATLTWANPALTELERQMEVPMFGEHPVEMGINDQNKNTVLSRFRQDPAVMKQFQAAFPKDADPVSFANIIAAIASFERALVSSDSRYDQFLQKKATLSASELRGMNLFMGEKAECFHCHGSFNFNDQVKFQGLSQVDTPFHNTGLYNIDGKGGFPFPNRGLFESTLREQDMGAFRAPSLRNVAVTAPYMHDGSIATLKDVLDFYAAGGRHITSGIYAGDGRTNPYKSDLITRINLSEQDKSDLIDFLGTLTDEKFLKNPRFSNPN
ncbi:methanobactin export MATE transporter MbnM [Undibacterium rugosum]|uniref:methanobactin export MATE transporter MbnM n=1 Tax=Undibacterium rugosum TaxID=2762291 RepID=UPI001B8106D4|nr:methanobactin export MATE transporter MbnM [Undibacterium rugosum]MBR7779878.1 di-heme enzyme [Undibacterium rugosum]